MLAIWKPWTSPIKPTVCFLHTFSLLPHLSASIHPSIRLSICPVRWLSSLSSTTDFGLGFYFQTYQFQLSILQSLCWFFLKSIHTFIVFSGPSQSQIGLCQLTCLPNAWQSTWGFWCSWAGCCTLLRPVSQAFWRQEQSPSSSSAREHARGIK